MYLRPTRSDGPTNAAQRRPMQDIVTANPKRVGRPQRLGACSDPVQRIRGKRAGLKKHQGDRFLLGKPDRSNWNVGLLSGAICFEAASSNGRRRESEIFKTAPSNCSPSRRAVRNYLGDSWVDQGVQSCENAFKMLVPGGFFSICGRPTVIGSSIVSGGPITSSAAMTKANRELEKADFSELKNPPVRWSKKSISQLGDAYWAAWAGRADAQFQWNP